MTGSTEEGPSDATSLRAVALRGPPCLAIFAVFCLIHALPRYVYHVTYSLKPELSFIYTTAGEGSRER